MKANATMVMVDGPVESFDRRAVETFAAWTVTLSDDDGETVTNDKGRPFAWTCRSAKAADALARDLARETGLEMVTV